MFRGQRFVILSVCCLSMMIHKICSPALSLGPESGVIPGVFLAAVGDESTAGVFWKL